MKSISERYWDDCKQLDFSKINVFRKARKTSTKHLKIKCPTFLDAYNLPAYGEALSQQREMDICQVS